jgi:hypothetical protein
MFHLTGVECKPPCPAADFSKANWGDHFGYDADGCMFSVIPTSVADDSSLRQAIKLKLKGIKRACHESAGTPLRTHAGTEALGLQDTRTAIRT